MLVLLMSVLNVLQVNRKHIKFKDNITILTLTKIYKVSMNRVK